MRVEDGGLLGVRHGWGTMLHLAGPRACRELEQVEQVFAQGEGVGMVGGSIVRQASLGGTWVGVGGHETHACPPACSFPSAHACPPHTRARMPTCLLMQSSG